MAIPAYNEEALIVETIKNVPEYVDFIVAIDDGSTDSTLERIQTIEDARLLVVAQKNCGVGGAIKSGFKLLIEKNCDLLIVVSGDNQMDQALMHLLIQPFLFKNSCPHNLFVKGDRISKKQNRKSMPKARLIGSLIISHLTRYSLGLRIQDPLNGYTCISRCFVESQFDQNFNEGYGYEMDLLCKLRALQIEIREIPMRSIYKNEISTMKPIRTFLDICYILLNFKLKNGLLKQKIFKCDEKLNKA